jgi:peptide deformylase
VVLDIVQVGDPILRHRARELEVGEIATPFVQELIAAMRHTVRGKGVGLAAPQVGESLRIIVVRDDIAYLESMSDARLDELGRRELPEQVLINPELTAVGDGSAEFFEGCLSIRGLAAIVSRASEVEVRALNELGEPVNLRWSGWPARILQHEVDHLDGTLYVDRMDSRTLTTMENQGRWWKARPADEVRAGLSA